MFNKYLFGVEVECITGAETSAFIDSVQGFGVDVASDSSIHPRVGEHGVELRTPPCSLGSTSGYLKTIEQEARRYNAYVNDSCGLHVHTSNPLFMESKNLLKILGLWVAVEDVFFATQPESRLNSHYCKRRLASYAVTGFPKLPEEKAQLLSQLGGTDRYYALNFASLQQHGTIECRLHAGTLSAEKITNWIILLTAFYDYALKSYKGKEVNELFAMPTSEKKIDLVWSLLKLKPEIRSHFNERIDKFLLTRLSDQHSKAQEILKFSLETKKEQKSIDKIIQKSYEIEELIRRKRDKIVATSDSKTNKMREEANLKGEGLKRTRTKLLKEFAGQNFKGDINTFATPWRRNSRVDSWVGSPLRVPDLSFYSNGMTTTAETDPHPPTENHNSETCRYCQTNRQREQRTGTVRPQTATEVQIRRDFDRPMREVSYNPDGEEFMP